MFDKLKSPRNIAIAVVVLLVLAGAIAAVVMIALRSDTKFGDSNQVNEFCSLSGMRGKKHRLTQQLQSGDALVAGGMMLSPNRQYALLVHRKRFGLVKPTLKRSSHAIANFRFSISKTDGGVLYSSLMEMNTRMFLNDASGEDLALSSTPVFLPHFVENGSEFIKIRYDREDLDILFKIHRTSPNQRFFSLLLHDIIGRHPSQAKEIESQKEREDWIMATALPIVVDKASKKLLLDDDGYSFDPCWSVGVGGSETIGGLVAQDDGNLVLYKQGSRCDGSTALWSSETWSRNGRSRAPYTLSLDDNGHLLWRNRQGALVWQAKCEPGPWKCMKTSWGKWHILRRDGLRNIECHSGNGRDCVYYDQDSRCTSMARTMNNGAWGVGDEPLTCGDKHKKVWGSRGDDDPRHWCFKGRTDI